ncbi:MAG: hypothetical protein A3J29_02215 [Acidobacteria bacterium RIFCSPLOWO2_12_FULL_67_14b]|nr:MAG: hypothetical protein A3J29_02215 [Acidobacteria bacterium RIFCSPLOWO2_12_FULL_67_14b]
MPVPTTAEMAARYRISDGRRFRLSEVDPADQWGRKLKKIADEMMKQGIKRLAMLQERLYADNRWSLLLIFQAMDAAGKDGTIEHVMSGVNPQGCEVYSFKAPSSEDLDHDFLWRTSKHLPRRGHIGIFNRSYYEETLVVRVHPNILKRQQLPPALVTKNIWKERYEDINAFEKYLSRQAVVVKKFFLHVSRKEQRRRFLKRIEESGKNWKFSPTDVKERDYYDDYMKAYEDTIRNTATAWAPWHVVPADRKWLTRLVVAATVIDAIETIDPRYPDVAPEVRAEFDRLKAELEAEAAQEAAAKEKAKEKAKA